MHLFSPASRTEAIDLISSHTPVPDTPGQRLLFAQPSLDRLFDKGQRAPERVWALRGDPGVGGLIAARLLGDFALIDMIAMPRVEAAAALLVDAATAWARGYPEAEASFEADAVAEPLADPGVARVVTAFGRAGWRVHVTRRHYHVAAADVAAASAAVPLSVHLERAGSADPADPADPARLVALLERVLPGSLDVRDQDLVARVGLAQAAAEQATDLLDSDPIECIRFAVIDGVDAGFASWVALPSGSAYVVAVGVAVEHRGRGLGGELVAAATRDLVAAGAHTLIADTDDDNLAMIGGFERAGWQPTSARIDLTLG
ncbi:GNAT family N-acetyltransferase [Occultella glacieicola]|uniref:GNAT family N-acetyltransferase n=1 Tax=Occultella glacieicola TaxID=2518684 RepID=A0ABY2E4A5_9MICO|nr:GNAT family N-acetyltransferase [Occultella glacieicola]TDE94860.1 GNAT family N-acetyltransferase [Occultella glacieicola]